MSLFRERIAAHKPAGELVLFHGWGASSDCWRPFLPLLRHHYNVTLVDLPGHGKSLGAATDPEQFILELLRLLPDRAVYLGWSLGGMIASRIAADHPERVQALITLASNPSFVQRSDWPAAMPRSDFEGFVGRFMRNPLRGLKRFDLLQGQGEPSSPDSVLYAAEPQVAVLNWLDLLDNRSAVCQVTCPTLCLFAEHDALVPARVCENVKALNPDFVTRVIACAGHSFYRLEQSWQVILEFLGQRGLHAESEQVGTLDKGWIARSFSKAAHSYDTVADLQRRVADTLLMQLPASEQTRILDLGCGTGYSLPPLKSKTPQLLALDLALGMLDFARNLQGRDADTWICGDAEDLPLADESVGLIFSSLSVQWCENIAAVFAEAYRVLEPGGQMLVSTLGPSTLYELREAGQAADKHTHVNRFLGREEVGQGIADSGLQLEDWSESSIVLEYQQLRELMAELKGLGAHNVNSNRSAGLMGKNSLRRFMQAYEAFRNASGLLPATYQVWYLQLSKPSHSV